MHISEDMQQPKGTFGKCQHMDQEVLFYCGLYWIELFQEGSERRQQVCWVLKDSRA